MKEKIMYLILGILIGAVITAGCFLVFAKGAKQPMDGKMGERLDFENMTEEEKEEMLEKIGIQGVNGENRKRPTNDVESVIPAIPISSFKINNQFKKAFKTIEDIAITKGVFESLKAQYTLVIESRNT